MTGASTRIPAASPPVLERARDLVTPVLRDAVGRLHPEVRRVAEYHLGWAEADGTPARSDSGKGVRPALALLSSEAAGADGSTSLPGGAAVELVHNFSLLHDDVMDGDRERRHRPTAWTVFGVGAAIIAGDALHTLAHQLLLEVDGPQGMAGASSLARATGAMIAGQADDMAFETEDSVSVESCLSMEAAKTGAILACASSIGAVLACAGPDVVGALHDYGLHLGQSFQAVDDLLGIWGDPARTGKPVASDLRQHKKSLPVVAAVAGAAERGGGAPEELAALLADPHPSEETLARAVALLEACGGRDRTLEEARRHLDLALAALDRAPLSAEPAAELAALARFVTDRER